MPIRYEDYVIKLLENITKNTSMSNNNIVTLSENFTLYLENISDSTAKTTNNTVVLGKTKYPNR